MIDDTGDRLRQEADMSTRPTIDELLQQGVKQLSRKYRLVARLPVGMTGLDALRERSPERYADVMRRAEQWAADEYRQYVACAHGDCERSHAGGRQRDQATRPQHARVPRVQSTQEEDMKKQDKQIQELNAAKAFLVGCDEDWHPDGEVPLKKIIERIVNERDMAQERLAHMVERITQSENELGNAVRGQRRARIAFSELFKLTSTLVNRLGEKS